MIAAPVVEGVAAALSASAGLLAYGVRVPSASLLAPSVCHGARTRPAIALTFDDGPSESTPALLEILARARVAATFFQCGANVRRLPAVAREIASAGHEIGNHTDTHPMLHFKSGAFMEQQVTAAQLAIQQATGTAPGFFRAPYGVRWFGLGQVQRRHNLTGVMWTTLALDWKRPVQDIVSRLARGAENGAIFCLHDGRELQVRPNIQVTLDAVRAVLPKLMEQGFHFEKVTDILCPTKN